MVTRIAAKIKRLFNRPQQPQAPVRLTIAQALDLSLAHGYAAVNWQGW